MIFLSTGTGEAPNNYMTWELESPIFPVVKAQGLSVKNWQDLILVNQVGKRFYDETKGDYPHGNVCNDICPYTPNDYRNNENIEFHPTKYNFFNAAVAMNENSQPPDYSAGPVWAIFDAEAVKRNSWNVAPPYVDPDGYFFSATTLAQLLEPGVSCPSLTWTLVSVLMPVLVNVTV